MRQVELTQRLNDKKTELNENRTTMDRSQAEHDKLRLEDVEYVDSFCSLRCVSYLLVAMRTKTKTVLKGTAALKTKTDAKVRSHVIGGGERHTVHGDGTICRPFRGLGELHLQGQEGRVVATPAIPARVNPHQCCPSIAYSSKTFNLTSPRRILISLIILKLAFRSTMVLATLSSQAHPVPFMGSSPTYVRSAPQLVLTKARSNSLSESQCSACVSSSWACHSTASISGMLRTR